MATDIQRATIELEKMEFYAYHGCFKEEQVVGNLFVVQISLDTNIAHPMISDRIQDALNYVDVYNIVQEEMMKTSNLLEHVTNRIISSLLRKFPSIMSVKIKVAKMNPPMGGKMKAVSVTLQKERE